MGIRALLGLGVTLALLGGSSLAETADLAPALRLTETPRVECHRPRTLRLRRFEDGSAQLRCAGRVLVRVSVPG
jgi:hypothetical protein